MYLRMFLMIFMLLCSYVNARFTGGYGRYSNRTPATNPFAPYKNNQDRVQGARGGLAQVDYNQFKSWKSPQDRPNFWNRESNWATNTTNRDNRWNRRWDNRFDNRKWNKSSGYSYEQDVQDDLPSFWKRSADAQPSKFSEED